MWLMVATWDCTSLAPNSGFHSPFPFWEMRPHVSGPPVACFPCLCSVFLPSVPGPTGSGFHSPMRRGARTITFHLLEFCSRGRTGKIAPVESWGLESPTSKAKAWACRSREPGAGSREGRGARSWSQPHRPSGSHVPHPCRPNATSARIMQPEEPG